MPDSFQGNSKPSLTIAAVAVLATMMSLTGCGGGNTDQTEPPTAAVEIQQASDTAQTANRRQAEAVAFVAQGQSVVVRPVAVTSSSTNGSNTPDKAIDASLDTRWESAHQNDAWIQFDFGTATKLGYAKFVWHSSYGQEYALDISDDGRNWSQFRYVSDGPGGTNEFFNLNIKTRYVRLRGIAPSGRYGYSLYDVAFKSQGADNTLGGTVTPSYTAYPSSGDPVAPPPPVKPPLEVLQFTLADGTLVTRWGMRAGGRHGRERGESWNEIGFGENETVDAKGNPVDKGPGSYLEFVANYFKNRTWGVEFIDNSKVPGVTEPRLIRRASR